jgi:hypothetical protein
MPADPSTLDLAALTAEAERLGYVRGRADGRGVEWLAGESVVARWLAGWGPPLADEAAALRWLLATPEARRLAAIVEAAEARGRAAERADVVAWLRREAEILGTINREDPTLRAARVDIYSGRHVGDADRAGR